MSAVRLGRLAYQQTDDMHHLEHGGEYVCDVCRAKDAPYDGQFEEPLCERCYAKWRAAVDFEQEVVSDADIAKSPYYLEEKAKLCDEFGVSPIMQIFKEQFGTKETK